MAEHDEQQSQQTEQPTPANNADADRTDLLTKARTFLRSPQVQPEPVQAKRRFLSEKGLTEPEVESLLSELPRAVPQVPPPTYPQPPPSNLPNLLAGIFRLFTWIAGGSAALLLVYYRFLLPRLTQSYHARYSLRSHQKTLLSHLNDSLSSLKDTQNNAFSVLPKPDPFKEDQRYTACHTLSELIDTSEGKPDIPPLTILRCALEEFASQKKSPTTEELFKALEAKLPWLTSEEEGPRYQEDLWHVLTTTPLFTPTSPTSQDTPTWTYTPPTPSPPTPLQTALTALHTTVHSPTTSPPTYSLTGLHQTLIDFTGYLTTQAYSASMSSSSSFRTSGPGGGFGLGPTLSPEEEDVRREIRALKGLVLNRRSFMPTTPKSSAPPTSTVPTP